VTTQHLPFPSWRCAHWAHEAIDAAKDVQELEIWLHDTAELSCSIEPATGALTTVRGGATGFACRVWVDDRCGWMARTVADVDDLTRLVLQARQAATRHGVPLAIPAYAASTTRPQLPLADGLSGPQIIDAARSAARQLTAAGAAVQAVIANRYQTIAGPITLSGCDAAEYYEDERLMVRCETAVGAVSDALSRMTHEGTLDTAPLLSRLIDALDTVAAPGQSPPTDLPVVLRPHVAAPVGAALAWLLSGNTALQHDSITRMLDRQVFPTCLQVTDPGTAEGESMRSIDDEGCAVEPLTLIDKGRPVTLLHSNETARALGHTPNGRGFRFGLPTQPAGVPVRLTVAPGQGRFPADFLELSCLVDNLSTMPMAGRLELIVAGWVVRDGQRRHRVAPFELNAGVLDLLRLLIATGDDPQRLPAAAESTLPSLALRRLP